MGSDTTLWSLALHIALVIGLCVIMIGLSWVLGERTPYSRATLEPYESGIVHVGMARFRFSAKYYLVAMFFVIFDLEAVFVIAWAVSAREAGWAGYVEMLVFLGILVAALAYLWRLGALDWAPKPRRLPAPGTLHEPQGHHGHHGHGGRRDPHGHRGGRGHADAQQA